VDAPESKVPVDELAGGQIGPVEELNGFVKGFDGLGGGVILVALLHGANAERVREQQCQEDPNNPQAGLRVRRFRTFGLARAVVAHGGNVAAAVPSRGGIANEKGTVIEETKQDLCSASSSPARNAGGDYLNSVGGVLSDPQIGVREGVGELWQGRRCEGAEVGESGHDLVTDCWPRIGEFSSESRDNNIGLETQIAERCDGKQHDVCIGVI